MIKAINPVSDYQFSQNPVGIRANLSGLNISGTGEFDKSVTSGESSKTAEKTKFSLLLQNADRTAGYMPVYHPTTPASAAMNASIEPSAEPSAASQDAPAPPSSSPSSTSSSSATAQKNQSGAEKPTDQIGFLDFLDIINPLQHIPIIGNIYRSVTGDNIKPVAKIIGDSIYGGPIGAATGMITTVLAQSHDESKQA